MIERSTIKKRGLQSGPQSFTISNMKRRAAQSNHSVRCLNASGEINILLAPFVFMIILFMSAAGFGLWAYQGRQDYKNNVDQKVAAAVKVAKQQESVVKDKQFDEANKQPLKIYRGPEQFGSLSLSYPKTWSGYVTVNNSGGQAAVDGYFQPDIVPSVTATDSSFALRVQVIDQSYATTIKTYDTLVTSKKLTASVFAFAKVPKVVGVRYDGAFSSSKTTTGSVVIVPIRDKTLKIWTESPVYAADFNNSILPNVSFSP